jgi:hypothetical protein
VRSIALRESQVARKERLAALEKQLLDPISSARASVQLEAIGQPAVEVLKKGLNSQDPEVRFYAAEALAYLDVSDAAKVLAEATAEPAFRVFALTALTALGDYAAIAELRELLNGNSAETRYGAFRALWAINPRNPLVMGENLGGQFSYHVLDASGTPMIHIAASKRPELVMFGQGQRFRTPLVLEAGNHILITSTDSGQIAVSRFAVGEADQRRLVGDRVDEVVRAIVELEGTYPDVVQALQKAVSVGALDSRIEVDALPEAGRTYHRENYTSEDTDAQPSAFSANSPVPNLFPKSGGKPAAQSNLTRENSSGKQAKAAGAEEKPRSLAESFARIMGPSRE